MTTSNSPARQSAGSHKAARKSARSKKPVRHTALSQKKKPSRSQSLPAARKKKAGTKEALSVSRPHTTHTSQASVAARKPAKARKEGSFCPVATQCGACTSITQSYDRQLARKQRFLEDLFRDVLDKSSECLPILGMEDPFYYRNKVVSPFAPGKKLKIDDPRLARGRRAHKGQAREILCGMYARNSHTIINTESCLLENQCAQRIISAIRDLCYRYDITPYNEDTGTGFLRHVIVRIGHSSQEVLVTLVTNQEQFVGSKNFCKELIRRCPEVTTVVQNINTRDTNVILGEGRDIVLYGPGFILDSLCGLSFRISAKSFYQVNAVQTEVLYRRAIELADLSGAERVIDAYCGTGTIGLVAAKGLPESPNAHAAELIGIDSVAAAIADAKNNARHNDIENARFLVGDAGVSLRDYAKKNTQVDVVMMDPPRAGSTEEFLSTVVELAPRRIVYISCNPKTQVRDCKFLCDRGYEIQVLQGVDMFPHTDHVESLCLLTLKDM